MTSTTRSTAATTSGIRIKSRVKAGFMGVTKPSPSLNHNQAAKGLRVKSRVKAGEFHFVTTINK